MQMGREQPIIEEPVGLLWTWWRGDTLPSLSAAFSLEIEVSQNVEILANLIEVSHEQVQKWLQEGHRAYIAYVERQPVAVGLSATGQTGFGGGRKVFRISAPDRYLYGFVTLPQLRGQGVYPRLLQYILQHESEYDERFWIIHQITNRASERGISKAGFERVGQICTLQDGGFGLVPERRQTERARVGATLLNISLVEDDDAG